MGLFDLFGPPPNLEPIEGMTIEMYADAQKEVLRSDEGIAAMCKRRGWDDAYWQRVASAWNKRVQSDKKVFKHYEKLFE